LEFGNGIPKDSCGAWKWKWKREFFLKTLEMESEMESGIWKAFGMEMKKRKNAQCCINMFYASRYYV